MAAAGSTRNGVRLELAKGWQCKGQEAAQRTNAVDRTSCISAMDSGSAEDSGNCCPDADPAFGSAASDSIVSGSAAFYKRLNGSTMVTQQQVTGR